MSCNRMNGDCHSHQFLHNVTSVRGNDHSVTHVVKKKKYVLLGITVTLKGFVNADILCKEQ